VSYPRLFLSAGVTTIRTTGSVDSYQELNLKRQIDSLLLPARHRRHGTVSQGYGQGPGAMHPPRRGTTPVEWCVLGRGGRDVVQGVHADLAGRFGAAIDEAHKHGVKVTAHLCSVGFREAVALGIDQLSTAVDEHRVLQGKQPDVCPGAAVPHSTTLRSTSTVRTCSARFTRWWPEVAMTSTLDVFELSSPSRVRSISGCWTCLSALSEQVAKVYAGGEAARDQRPAGRVQEGDGVRSGVREGRCCSAQIRSVLS